MKFSQLTLISFLLITGFRSLEIIQDQIHKEHSYSISTLGIQEIHNVEELNKKFEQQGTYFFKTFQNHSIIIQKGINPKTREIFSKAWILKAKTIKPELLIDNLLNIKEIYGYLIDEHDHYSQVKLNNISIEP